MHSSIRWSAAGFAALLVTSCSMPPRQAWQQIQTRGLIPYMMSNGAPLQVTSQRSSTPLIGSTAPAVNTTRTYATTPNSGIIGPVQPTTPPPSMLNSSNMPVALSVPDLPGYVRSPFTNPPRLVDVRGMNAGSKVVCPYTQKPFLVPGGVNSGLPASKVASNTTPRRIEPSAPPVAPGSSMTAPVPNSNVAALTKPSTPAPSTPAPSINPAPTQPKVDASPSIPELPYGSPISGRPGFVNSPYAAKHQLVDVTGLPVGMEVKCPYTGKLFRVPPQ